MSNIESQGTGKPKSFKEKCVHVGKVIIFLITFGFAFPHIFSD